MDSNRITYGNKDDCLDIPQEQMVYIYLYSLPVILDSAVRTLIVHLAEKV